MLNIVANPNFSIQDFATIGFNVNNISLQDESVYKNSPTIQSTFVDQTGKFDEKAFNNIYNAALVSYNYMANQAFQNQQMKIYHRDNIDAPFEMRDMAPNFKMRLVANPRQITESIFRFGEFGTPLRSDAEIAQGNQVLLNPNEVFKNGDANWDIAQWDKSPNSSFWHYFDETLVLAQWDEAGTHKDPVTGEMVQHEKGELKIGEDGSFFYERLDGRDVYGRRVLNKMDVITEDGSFWNKYDPFDSDDIDQNIGKTLLKNAFLVGSMFIPHVGPIITGLNILTQLVGITGTLGRMFAGSNSAFFSNLEGWGKSMNRQTARSEYAQQHVWCWENFLNTIGDAVAQIREQRVLFEKVPAIFKGGSNTKEALDLRRVKYIQEETEFAHQALGRVAETGSAGKFNTAFQELLNPEVLAVKAETSLNEWVKGYNRLGSIISKSYMTAITVQDTYGEAKAAGASDIEATLLTLGYAGAEAYLLNTGIGEWLYPELRAEKQLARKAVKTLTTPMEKAVASLRNEIGTSLEKAAKTEKQSLAIKIFNKGKSLFNAEFYDKSLGKGMLASSFAGAIGEAVEEVSEEVLADFSKGVFNTINWLRGDDTRMHSFGFKKENGKWSWDGSDVWDRYGMSFVGGFFGGGLANIKTNYSILNTDMTPEKAHQQIVYLAREKKLGEVRKIIDKQTFGNPNLSATKFKVIDGKPIAAPGTETDNQDLYVKKTFKRYLDFVEKTLEAQGSTLSDDSFLASVLGDLKYHQLYKSQTAYRLLNDFNKINSDIVKLVGDITSLELQAKDTNNDKTVTDPEDRQENPVINVEQILKDKKKELSEKQKQLDDLVSGKLSDRYVGAMLVEVIPELHKLMLPLSFDIYVKSNFNGRTYEQLSKSEKKRANEEFRQWGDLDRAEQLHQFAGGLMETLRNFSTNFKKQEDTYLNQSEKIQKIVSNLTTIYTGLNDGTLSIDNATTELNNASIETALAQALDSDKWNAAYKEYIEGLNKVKTDESLSEAEKDLESNRLNNEFEAKVKEIVSQNLENSVKEFVDQGFINNDIKRMITPFLDIIESRYDSEVQDIRDEVDDAFGQEKQVLQQKLDEFQVKVEEFKQLRTKFENLSNTPYEQYLDEFSMSMNETLVKFSKVLQKVNTLLNVNKDDLALLDMSNELLNEVKNAINTINLYQTAILASKADDANSGNLFGFTKTLNEVLAKMDQKPQYAEINTDFANVLYQDLENAKQKLTFVVNLFNANSGNKAVLQTKIEEHVCKLIYDKFKTIIQVPDEDKELENWQSFQKFASYINNTENFKILSKLNQKSPTTKQEKKQLQKEIAGLFDAVYDFFNFKDANGEIWTNDPRRLQLFVNHGRFNPFIDEESPILNLNLKEIPDTTFLHMIASMASVKYSDFLSSFKDTIDASKGILPIFSQELAAFMGYSFIANGNSYTHIINNYNDNVINAFVNADKTQRTTWLQQLGVPSDSISKLITDEYLKITIPALNLSKYDNIYLVEGIAGSGKTSVVFRLIWDMIQKNHPDKIDSAWTIHLSDEGSDTTQGTAILKNLDIKEGRALSIEEFFSLVCPEYKEISYDPQNQKSSVNEGEDYIINKNKVQSTWGINKNIQGFPRVILLDEVGKLNSLQLNILDQVAKYYGSTIIAAGDFDQTKNTLTVRPEIENEKQFLRSTSRRNHFIHAPKLGSSIRTDNSVKTSNNNKYQYWKNNGYQNTLQLQYHEDAEGNLYGDKIIQVKPGDTHVDKVVEAVKKLIKTLKPNEQITYIAQEGSPLHTKLTEDSDINPKLNIVTENKAQGRENRYYIIETNKNASELQKDLDATHDLIYTGITRAKQGSILVAPTDSLKIESKYVDEIVPERFESQIATMSKTKKEILNELFPNSAKIPYKPRKTQNNQQSSNSQRSQGQSQTNPQGNSRSPVTIPSTTTTPTPTTTIVSLDEMKAKYGDMIDIKGIRFNYRGNNYSVPLQPIQIRTVDSNGNITIEYSPFFKYKVPNRNVGESIVTFLKIGDGLLPVAFNGTYWLPLVNYTEGTTQTSHASEFNNQIDSALKSTVSNLSNLPILTDLSIFENLQIPTDPRDYAMFQQNLINNQLGKNKLTPPNSKFNVGDYVFYNNTSYKIVNFEINSENEIEYHLSNENSEQVKLKESEIRDDEYIKSIDSLNNFKKGDLLFYENENREVEQVTIVEINQKVENGNIVQSAIIVENSSGQEIIIEESAFSSLSKTDPTIQLQEEINAAARIHGDSFEDNLGIDTIIETNEVEYQESLDSLNETGNPQPTISQINDKAIKIGILFYNHNCLELGALVDEYGRIKDDTQTNARGEEINMSELRIDSANGLRKILQKIPDSVKGNKWKLKSNQTQKDLFLDKLNKLQEIIIKTPEKVDILKQIENLLGYKPEFINFNFKLSPVFNEDNDSDYVASESLRSLGKYGYNQNEEVYYNPSNDSRSKEVIPHKITATIGTKEDGEILEIPIFTITNPVTLILSDELRDGLLKPMSDYWKSLDPKLKFGERCGLMVKQFKNSPEFVNVVNLFRLFVHTKTGFCRINEAEYNRNDVWKDWTPAKNLKDFGLRVTSKAGRYHDQSGMQIARDSLDEYYTLSELKANPRFSISDRVMIATATSYSNDGKVLWKKGHPFVFVGTSDLSSQDLMAYYRAQMTPNTPESKHPKVRLMYVLPPASNIGDYIHNIQNKFKNLQPDNRNIGHLFTPHQVLNIILKNDNIIDLLKEIYRFDNDVNARISQLQNIIQNIMTVENDKTLSQEDKITKIKNDHLYKQIEIESGQQKILDLDGNPVEGKKQLVINYLSEILIELAQNDGRISPEERQNGELVPAGDYDENVLNLMDSLLKTANYIIYYRGNSINQNSPKHENGLFVEVDQENDYKIDGKPFRVNKKIDTTVCSLEDAGDLIAHILENLEKPQKDFYLKPKPINNTPAPNNELKVINKNIQKVKNLVEPELAELLLNQYSLNDISDAKNQEAKNNLKTVLKTLVEEIQLNHPTKAVFTINNEIFVSDNHDQFEGSPVVYINNQKSGNANEVTVLNSTSGAYEFELRSRDKIFDAKFYPSSGNLEIFQKNMQQPQSEPQRSLLNIDLFNNFKVSTLQKLQSVSDPKTKMAVNAIVKILSNDSENYVSALRNSIKLSPKLVEAVNNYLGTLEDSNEKSLIQNILDIISKPKEQRILPDQNIQENEENNGLCPPTKILKVK